MAWLQSSFTNSHQVLGDSVGSSHRKGYKVGSLNKNTDPDKSDTPLLQDTSCLSPDKAKDNSDWFKDDSSSAPKKQNAPGKSSFLTSSFFDKSSINSKLKPLTGSRESSQNAGGQASKLKKENSKLLRGEKSENLQCEDDDEESDDDWCIFPTSGGYQKVKSGAD